MLNSCGAAWCSEPFPFNILRCSRKVDMVHLVRCPMATWTEYHPTKKCNERFMCTEQIKYTSQTPSNTPSYMIM